MSVKIERLGNVLHKEISNILLTEIKDEDLKFVTITSVKLSNDMSYAKVYFTTLDDSKKDIVIRDLNNAKGFIRSVLMKRKIEMRIMHKGIPNMSLKEIFIIGIIQLITLLVKWLILILITI
jgi:ribosome-binding factor A